MSDLGENQSEAGEDTLPRLRHWLEHSNLSSGARVPPERILAQSLGVSRADLRKALLVLESEGRLERHVGRGTFLKDANATGPADAILLAGLANRTGPHEAMTARLALEPELARLAALNATPRQIADLKRLSRDMRNAGDWETYEALDSSFHDLIAEATGNLLLHEVSRIVNGVRRAVVWSRLFLPTDGPNPEYHSFDEHDAIVEALENRNRSEARTAMRKHIEATLGTMMAEE